MTATNLAQKLSTWADSQAENIQRRLETPVRVKFYRVYGKSILLPMLSIGMFSLTLIVLLILKLFTMPVIYYGGRKHGDD